MKAAACVVASKIGFKAKESNKASGTKMEEKIK